MYNTLLRMWKKNKLSIEELHVAVTVKHWITEEEEQKILNTPKSI